MAGHFDTFAFTAALILIKARIILKMKLSLARFRLFKKCLEDGNSVCQKILNSSLVMDKIEKMLPHNTKEIKRQMDLLKKYINFADKTNKHFLKAVLNPAMFTDMSPPRFVQMGTMSELYDVIKDCAELYARNGIVMRLIKEKVGGK